MLTVLKYSLLIFNVLLMRSLFFSTLSALVLRKISISGALGLVEVSVGASRGSSHVALPRISLMSSGTSASHLPGCKLIVSEAGSVLN